MATDFDQAFAAALISDDPKEQLFRLAEAMKAAGRSQRDIYRWFVEKQGQVDRKDPNHTHLGDTLDFIYGGPMANGYVLFPGSDLGATGCAC